MQLENFEVGGDNPLFVIAGPCVIESETLIMETATALKELGEKVGVSLIFKSSFDKANRSSMDSYRGPGIEEGLRILERVKTELTMPVLTDVHEDTPLDEVASVVDVMQTPAFLCRQTNFILNVCAQGKPVNIKKGQFLAPLDMLQVAKKAKSTGNEQIMVCERGASFGYNNLVVDMLGFSVMKSFGYPLLFDVTHALQRPGGMGDAAAGRRESLRELALSGMSQKIAGLFLEAHPEPEKALCDGPCALRLNQLEPFLQQMKAMDDLVKTFEPLATS